MIFNLLLFFKFPLWNVNVCCMIMLSVSPGVELPPKAEIAKAVADVFSVVFFNALEHMWVVSDYKVCTFINGEMCKSLLVLVRCILLFNSPMEIYDDNLSTGFFQCFDILFYLRCTFLVIRKLIDSGNTDFDSFYFKIFTRL